MNQYRFKKVVSRFAAVGFFFSFLTGTALYSKVPDSAWGGLKDKEVKIEKTDGGEIQGVVINVTDSEIAISKKDGTIVAIKKSEAENLRVLSSPQTSGGALKLDPNEEKIKRANDLVGAAVALNILVGYGIGSFVQGNTSGGAAQLVIHLLSTSGLIAGLLVPNYTADLVLFGAALGLSITGLIVGIVSPIEYPKKLVSAGVSLSPVIKIQTLANGAVPDNYYGLAAAVKF